jgi:hypothetical protein
VKPTRRRSEIRVTGADGVTRAGAGMAAAVRALAEQHAAEALDETSHQAACDRRNEPDRWPSGLTHDAELRPGDFEPR